VVVAEWQARKFSAISRPDQDIFWLYSWLSLSRTRLTRISGWVEFLSKSRTSLCINIYNLTPVKGDNSSKILKS
jgi:hypothetical protein